jgi:F420-non-reducing hydrogenase large subunit
VRVARAPGRLPVVVTLRGADGAVRDVVRRRVEEDG